MTDYTNPQHHFKTYCQVSGCESFPLDGYSVCEKHLNQPSDINVPSITSSTSRLSPEQEEHVEMWIKQQHGTAGWQTKLKNLVAEECQRAVEDRDKEISASLLKIKQWAATLQKAACAYGTIEGSGGRCDCKFLDENTITFSLRCGDIEQTGCCEARSILWEINKLSPSLKQESHE